MSRKHKGLPVNGWLVVDKPIGMTSTQVVGKARWAFQAAKAGHGGTLDPLATGVLPIAFGEATKTVAYAMDGHKTYRFSVCWGEARTTDDTEGDVCERSDHRPDAAAIAAALPRFTGTILQVPPQYSALKVAGERAYDLARSGEVFDLAARPVRIDAIELLSLPDADHAEFEVHCGKGTYIRSLARDLALTLGTVGHVASLRRLQVGRFTLDHAICVDELDAIGQNNAVERSLLPIETALDDIPALPLTAPEALRLHSGQSVALLSRQDEERLLAVAPFPEAGPVTVLALCDGQPVAIASVEGGVVRVVRAFNF